jgi:hypothetical protein
MKTQIKEKATWRYSTYPRLGDFAVFRAQPALNAFVTFGIKSKKKKNL